MLDRNQFTSCGGVTLCSCTTLPLPPLCPPIYPLNNTASDFPYLDEMSSGLVSANVLRIVIRSPMVVARSEAVISLGTCTGVTWTRTEDGCDEVYTSND